MPTEVKQRKPRAPRKPKETFALPDGTPVPFVKTDKFFRDILRYQYGVHDKDGTATITIPDAYAPIVDEVLTPGKNSPICAKCGLDQQEARYPYMEPAGSNNPVATIIVESVSRKEDDKGSVCSAGTSAWLAGIILKLEKKHGVALKDIRWVPITRCSPRVGKLPNFKTKGNWCRYHLIQDLALHPPQVIIPVGTAVLGLLSHKSNAQDWSGKLLTWRGWPDDWLTDPKYMFDRPDPMDPAKMTRGHPLFGGPPSIRIPIVPIQKPQLVLREQNPKVTRRFHEDIVYALQVGLENIPPPDYDRPWYNISVNPQEIISVLKHLIALAHKHAIKLAYDTETTGLKQWAHFKKLSADEIVRSEDPRIVFMMFRWVNPETEKPESIGFPWDYPESELKPFLDTISPYVLEVLSTCEVIGHNLTFDELFTIATVGRQENEFLPFLKNGGWNPAWLALQERINNLAEHAKYDTWHMAFIRLQRRGSLGLEILAYDHVPDLAGYEEDMTLLIQLHGDKMNPANGKGGHYAMCPKELWNTHLKPYVMGDVEATYGSFESLSEKLANSRVYKIPLSNPERPGSFRYYQPPSRDWVYKNIVSPASQTLIKMMARGMFIDQKELAEQEEDYPNKVADAKEKLRSVDPVIERWCLTKAQEAKKAAQQNPNEPVDTWELDLENKGQLKELLFDVLQCPIQRLTKNGRKIYGDNPEDWAGIPYSEKRLYAAVDKFTLNKLAVDHPNLRPLQEYRKVFKLYGTYVRPMRNMMAQHLDKKERVKEPHLSIDSCIHAGFLLTGTRSGRLSSRDPNLQQLPNEGLVKRLFASRFGDRGCIYAADLSQIELRLMAAACGDKSMVEAYLNDVDIHSLTASKITWQDGKKIPYEHFTKKYMEKLQHEKKSDEAKQLELKRKIAKTVNFLTGYGGGAFGLQNVLANAEVYMDIEECELIIASFFDAYPILKKFLGVYKSFIEDHGVAVSMFGRVRHFEEVYSDDPKLRSQALRAGCNHLIQSTASDTMLICLIAIEALMRDADLKSLLVSTVHDSLVIDSVREELDQVHAIVNGVMNNIPAVVESMLPGYDSSWMIVPLAGDSEVGLNYLETNKISGDNPDWDELLLPKVHKK